MVYWRERAAPRTTQAIFTAAFPSAYNRNTPNFVKLLKRLLLEYQDLGKPVNSIAPLGHY